MKIVDIREKRSNILGVNFHTYTFDEALQKVLEYLKSKDRRVRTIYTPNPEFVMLARKDEKFLSTLNKGDLLLPDGIGIVIASKFIGKKIKERVTGFDLSVAILDNIKNTDHTVYFLGAAPGVAEIAKMKMEKKYPGIKIIGVQNGFFDKEKEHEIIKEIISLKPDFLLVGTGSPRQEFWIEENKSKLPCKVIMGVGGSFDGMSGRVKRAPEFIVRLNLEWLYRLIKQPSRFKRQLELPKFMFAVIWEALRKKR